MPGYSVHLGGTSRLLRTPPRGLSWSATLRRTIPVAPTGVRSPLVTFPGEATRRKQVVVVEHSVKGLTNMHHAIDENAPCD